MCFMACGELGVGYIIVSVHRLIHFHQLLYGSHVRRRGPGCYCDIIHQLKGSSLWLPITQSIKPRSLITMVSYPCGCGTAVVQTRSDQALLV